MIDRVTNFPGRRGTLLRRLFPRGMPTLWCPILTHFDADGRIDAHRMRAHITFMRPWVKGLLIAGSTGEGWEMTPEDVQRLLSAVVEIVTGGDMHLQVGALKAESWESLAAMRETVLWLQNAFATEDVLECFEKSSICGFTICPPSGAGMTQSDIVRDLETVLSPGYPVALYQLPQITRNEMTPPTVAALATRFPNFLMLKDTSGSDRIAASGFRDVVLVRGAEGGYADQLRSAGGPYDGFLLSTANCLAPQLAKIIAAVESGEVASARSLSKQLTSFATEAFGLADRIGFGNPFTNANKAIDHFFAFGPSATEQPPPRLYSGKLLPRDFIDAIGRSLGRFDLMPEGGYL
jgi:dihydrodipicolinate synthase/N-acetylneuraminate lyase